MEKEAQKIERSIKDVQEDQRKAIFFMGAAHLKIREAEQEINHYLTEMVKLKSELDEFKKLEEPKAN